MQTGSKEYLLPFNNLILNNGDQGDVKVETDQIDFMGDDFKFDGRNIWYTLTNLIHFYTN